ncbi:hypothetical protein Tco_1524510 [Tanacetum coccineum]
MEAAKTLSKVASQRSKSVDKGKRYKRRKVSKGKDIDTGFKDISTGFEGISTGFEDISTGFEEVNTGGLGVSTGSGPVSSARGQREGKAPMIVEETQAPKRTKEQIQQEEATKLEANAELAKSVIAKDMSEEDFAKRMVDLVNQRKKYFAEEREKAKRIEEVEAELKRFGEELQTKTTKRQKIDDKDTQSTEEKEKEPDEAKKDEASEEDDSSSGTNVPINPVPVAVKSPSIASYKIIKQGKKGVYQIVREMDCDEEIWYVVPAGRVIATDSVIVATSENDGVSYDLDKSLFSTYDKVYSLKKSQKDKDKDEDPSAGSDRGLKKRETSKDAEPTKEEPEFEVADSAIPQDQTPQQGPIQSWLMTFAATTDKPLKTFDEFMSTPIDFSAYIMNGLKITNMTQETLLGPAFKLLKGTRTNFTKLEYDFEECYKSLSEKLDWDNPEGGVYPFDLTKPLPFVMNGNRIKDMVPNIWSPVKVAYDKHAIWGISHWREQHNTFYGYARGLESSHDVYSTKHILAVTRVEEGDFPRLRINDIEDMLILVVQNRLTNLLGSDVSDFAIALRMFTRSMPETTRPDIRKRDPYTPYQDPQGLIYVDNQGRNMLMHSDELYKFNDGTLTRLRTSLDDITKNIRMEYLPQRRWSSLEKKRSHIIIKAIDKQLKEKRMMRSFEKFVGGRHYETDLWLLQRTI